MNFLSVRKGPELDFIHTEHKEEFVRDIIQLYSLSAGSQFIPSLDTDIAPELPATYLVAGISEGYCEKDFFKEDVLSQSHDPIFLEYWAQAQVNSFTEQDPEIVLNGKIGMYFDAKAVLDHYKMFYLFELVKSEGMESGIVLANMPISDVW